MTCLGNRVFHLVVVIFKKPSPLGIEDPELTKPHLLEPELQRGCQNAQPILHTAREVNRGGLGKILRRTGYFADAVLRKDDLRKYLVVEYKVVGILL